MSEKFELFHKLGDPPSSRIRKRITDLGLLPQSSFRNVAFDSHRVEFESGGAHELPAIRSGDRWYEGEAACNGFLDEIPQSSRH